MTGNGRRKRQHEPVSENAANVAAEMDEAEAEAEAEANKTTIKHANYY